MGSNMVGNVILEFDTLQKAQTCLYIINQLAAAYWASEGYTVLDTPKGKALVGKNAATGEDMPDSAKTITWDVVQVSPNKTYYFNDPAQREQFSKWEERALEMGYVFDGVRKEFPIAWLPKDPA